MNYFREKVSGNKKRYVDKEFDLDLSYITPRLIAMAIPGEGMKKLYRNNINDVKSFLEKKHYNQYLIINISGIKYAYELFENKVVEFEWIDHQAPKLNTLFSICKEIYSFLSLNSENVTAINCKAGKGRTGTIICCFLLFSGMFNNPQKALDYYSIKRFKSGEGVTQPSQKRYIYFFNEILQKMVFYPLRVSLTGVYVDHFPSLASKESVKTFLELYLENSDKLSYTNQKSNSEQRKIYANKNSIVQITDDDFNFPIIGDFTISIFENNFMGNNLIGRISYNTAFLKSGGGFITFSLEHTDPDNLINNKEYDKNFQIIVKFYFSLNTMLAVK